MSASVTLLGGAALGVAAGSLLVPLTRRELAASVARSSSDHVAAPRAVTAAPRIPAGHRVALAAASGLLPAYVLHRVGWSIIALPPCCCSSAWCNSPYCDLTRRLLPKTLVYALSAAVIVSGVVVAGVTHEWQRLLVASLGGLAFFALFFVVNLMNPRWLAFGDVRLSLVVGFGLAWVSPIALLEGFFFANLLALRSSGSGSSQHTGPNEVRPCPSASTWPWAPRWCSSPGARGRPGPLAGCGDEHPHVLGLVPPAAGPDRELDRRAGRDGATPVVGHVRMVHEQVLTVLAGHEPKPACRC